MRSFVLYPACIDASRSRVGGRKWPANKCVPQPRFAEIKLALERAEIKFTAEPDKRYPRDQCTPGRFTVEYAHTKQETVDILLDELSKNRQRKADQLTTEGSTNPLKLVARRKQKSKK